MPKLPPKIIFRVMAGIWIILVERREESEPVALRPTCHYANGLLYWT